MKRVWKRPAVLIFVLCLAAAFAVGLPLAAVSCRAQKGGGDDGVAVERLRALTRGGAKPPESALAQFAAEHEGTRAGALALLAQARLRAAAGDHARAAELLRSGEFEAQTSVGDHALWLRAESLEKLGRRVEARAALEELARKFPDSQRAREAALRAAKIMLDANQAAGVPVALKELVGRNNAEALLLSAKAYEATGDAPRALEAYRRLYFYAPASKQHDSEAAAAFARLGSPAAPATSEEAAARAEALFNVKRFSEAVDAYAEAFTRFPQTATPEARLRRGVSAYHARRAPETVAALGEVPPSPPEVRAEAAYYFALHYARAKQWPQLRDTLDLMARGFPASPWTMRALVAAGQAADEAKYASDALAHSRRAVQLFPGEPEVAGAQFRVAWAAHDAGNFAESSRLLTEHLAFYADRNTDNRGRAGYWAARDTERAGKLSEARALYEGMLARYDANWYGYLSRQRLEELDRRGTPAQGYGLDSVVGRAVENLKPVAVADERAGSAEAARLTKADQLAAAGADDLAHAELDEALKAVPDSPALNLAKAKLHRARTQNVQAINVLRRSLPDYSQMKPEEMTRDEWDVFYPLAYWEVIVRESRARSLDPYTVAGLIRQESVFDPRAASHADAYGLMQLLVPTARLTARTSGDSQGLTAESLYDPALNIRLGTTYFRQNLDKFGRVEYVAAAYNAGPGRAVAWRSSLPPQIDEWTEAIPFRETRGYVQGVIRNTLQYRRLYDDQGRFRPEVGTRAARRDIRTDAGQPTDAPAPNAARPRRVSNEE
ncbi:MAG TPA: transglycosylase SLT domain-containing protein [Pyrinomonadaceae bacterium]|nr:transglycosylase SLT domain-containing protein [Pyrinomonadaceae bacterium]